MNTRTFLLTSLLLVSLTEELFADTQNEAWGYICSNQKCNKVQLNEENIKKAQAFSVCRMFCSDPLAAVWPKPTGSVKFKEQFLAIDQLKITFDVPDTKLWESVQKRFFGQLSNKINNNITPRSVGNALKINVVYTEALSDLSPKLTLDTDESYKLTLKNENENVIATIAATSFFGARHGIETLSQLIVYDNIHDELKIVANAEINDGPVYKWRGLVLDTSRNFFSLNTIKTILDGMAMTKLNTFHWHITDSHSFPFEVKKQPELHRLGAYDSNKVYTHEHIADIVKYGLERGIRILPEFDAPAHVGEGWQNLDMTACFNLQPWQKYCVEPPCGQLDPSVPKLYDVLENIYREMDMVFKPDVFHMGGDEVSVQCWNSSTRIQDWMKAENWGLEEADFIRLWDYFQRQALKRYDKIKQNNDTSIILWTSRLTETPYVQQYLDPQRYIIQIWTTANDPKIQNLLKRGFRIIISNYDALYFDCGGPGWVQGGQNWCSPYHGWQKIYTNNLNKISGRFNNLVLGAEAAIWSEQIDDYSVLPRAFPRLSALGENLWSNPEQDWKKAESRMLLHRDLLVQNNIPAESLQPQWCLQNENECPIDAYTTNNF